MSSMTDRETKIIEAATRVFLRYGVKRTTMNDIAQEAEIARQTLYNAFSNKDDLVRALIRAFNERAVAAIAADCAGAGSIGRRLDAIFRHMVVTPFEMLSTSPHAQDILDGLNAAARDEIQAAEADYRHAIAGSLAPMADAIGRRGLSVARLAEVIYCSAKAAKDRATDREHLTQMLDTLKVLVLDLENHPD